MRDNARCIEFLGCPKIPLDLTLSDQIKRVHDCTAKRLSMIRKPDPVKWLKLKRTGFYPKQLWGEMGKDKDMSPVISFLGLCGVNVLNY